MPKKKHSSKNGNAEALSLAPGSGLPAFFDRFPNAVSCQRIPGGIIFRWSRKGIGHGMLTLRVVRGKLEVDGECMNSDFCAAVVKQAIDEASPNGGDEPRAGSAATPKEKNTL